MVTLLILTGEESVKKKYKNKKNKYLENEQRFQGEILFPIIV